MSLSIDKIMITAVVEAKEDETLGEIRGRMASHDISAVPVVNANEALVGIVTADDLMSVHADTLPVSRVMTTTVHTLSPKADVSVAAALMRKHRHHHIVVLDGQRVVGIVSSLDLLRLIEQPSGAEAPS
jgi:CBS domain-containing protein